VQFVTNPTQGALGGAQAGFGAATRMGLDPTTGLPTGSLDGQNGEGI
jgi:hypothetical protein